MNTTVKDNINIEKPLYNKNTKYCVTEWDWFKLQLELYSIKYRSEMYSVIFNFESDNRGRILCRIFGAHAETMIANNATKTEQLEYYKDWFEGEKQRIIDILENIPVLKITFDLEKDVVYQIMYNYGMGASIICELEDGEIVWHHR